MFIMLLTVAALPVRTYASTPTVVISEIAWAGSSSSASDEWIELTNVSDSTVDLSGWKLTGAGSSGAELVLPDNAQIEPHSTYLIANYEHTHANSALESAPDFVTATLSLPNGGFSLALFDSGGALMDVAGGAGSPFAGGSGSTGDSADGRYQSMVRIDGLGDGSLEESWADADTASGFKAGVEDLGTPDVVAFATLVIEEETVEESVVTEEVDPGLSLGEPEETESAPSDLSTLPDEEEPDNETDPASVRISEFVVDPNEGESEWIEIVNPGLESVDLTGWTLEDATGKQTLLEGSVAAGEYLLATAPLGKLNNDTDSIFLKDAAGVLVDSVEYGTNELATPKDGAALARGMSGSFELTYATTPGNVNVIDPEKPEAEELLEVDSGFPATHSLGEGGSLGESEEAVEESPTDESVESVPSDLSALSDEASTAEETAPANIRINEFVVDPLGDGVEWIELFNAGIASVTLEGWTLEDASGKATDLSGVTIEADSYAVIESPKGKLNNEADSVILKDAGGTIVESVVYGGDGYAIPKDGEALARDADVFKITELTTPGSPNLIFVAIEEIKEEGSEVDSKTGESQVEVEATEEVELIKTLRFVTLYPNATGSDEEEEYIVIENIGTEAIDLLSWSIEDGSTDQYTFESSLMIVAGATLTLSRPESKLTLNNNGDTLELIAPDGDVVDLVTYGNSAKGATYDLVNGTWMWSGTATVAESTVAESTATESTTTSTPTTASVTNTVTNSTNSTYASTATSSWVAQVVTIAQAKEKSDGTNVIVKGVVTSTPGTFGSQIFYIQDETGGIQVYLYNNDFPELAPGDVVRVTGELSTSRGERRVKLANAAGVVSANGMFTSQPIELAVSDVDESLVGILLTTEGLIQSIDTNKLIIEKEGVSLTIYLKSNPVIDAQQFERGDKIEVTGVLTSYDGELRLRPRFSGDITVVDEAVVASVATTESSGGSSAGMILLITTIAAFIVLALWRYLPRRRLTQAAA